VCRRHENVQFKFEKLYQLKLISSKSAEDQLSDMCCDVTQRSCMYRECEVCKDKTVQFTRPTLLESDKSVVVWAEWVTESDEYKKGEKKLKVKRIVKKIQRGTPEELKQALISEFDAGFSVHVFNLRHQFQTTQQYLRNMGRQPNTGTNIIFFSSQLKFINWGSREGRGIFLRPVMAKVPRMPWAVH
jgi:hypothetical protein